MAANDPRPLPTQIPPPDYERIRAGDMQALADALRTIVNAFNEYLRRKGG